MQHHTICKFPSQCFYDNKLASPNQETFPRPLSIWPNKASPMVFCHVEGMENTLSVSTADGNEQSRSNVAEQDEAVSNLIICVD